MNIKFKLFSRMCWFRSFKKSLCHASVAGTGVVPCAKSTCPVRERKHKKKDKDT